MAPVLKTGKGNLRGFESHALRPIMSSKKPRRPAQTQLDGATRARSRVSLDLTADRSILLVATNARQRGRVRRAEQLARRASRSPSTPGHGRNLESQTTGHPARGREPRCASGEL